MVPQATVAQRTTLSRCVETQQPLYSENTTRLSQGVREREGPYKALFSHAKNTCRAIQSQVHETGNCPTVPNYRHRYRQSVSLINTFHLRINEPGWLSILSDYGLNSRAIEVRSPAEAKDFFSSLCVLRLWGPPSLLYNEYRGSFPGGKARPGRDADHSPPSSAKVENE
jgi:hypothetical protein